MCFEDKKDNIQVCKAPEIAFAKVNDNFHIAKSMAHSQSILTSHDLSTPLAELIILPKMLSSLGVQNSQNFLEFCSTSRVAPLWSSLLVPTFPPNLSC